MSFLPFIALFVPLAAAMAIAVALRKFPRAAALVSIGACGASLLCAVLIFWGYGAEGVAWSWLDLPGLRIEAGAMTDALARLMLLVVTGVGFLIHLFSYGYMKNDKSFSRFFAKMSFFLFSMIGVTLADNLVMMFFFWELVGLSSYLLIGFWFERPSAAEAAKKAFIVNRIGDVGFMAGILLVWQIGQTVNFEALEQSSFLFSQSPLTTLAALALFCGCVGKSAQLPLHVWLPDAMEGPTPVSALIHAATMVAAGVYMLCRVFCVLQWSATAMSVIAIVGAATALFAALVAVRQDDIKRVLAYSTMSQLGYMVMAVGLGSQAAAMFHLSTHAFFKALLFLAAGSVLCALHHEQNIWQMGGLRKMKITFAAFLIGAAALAGVPFFSGFFSKEEILSIAFQKSHWLFAVALVTSVLTAFYMTRLALLVFSGEARTEEARRAVESPLIMTLPLIALAVLSVVGSYWKIGETLSFPSHNKGSATVIIASLAALLLGVVAAWIFYAKAKKEPLGGMILARGFYVDEIYRALIIRAQDAMARFLAWWEQWIAEGLAFRFPSILGECGEDFFRRLQSGNIRAYATVFLIGFLFLCYWILRGAFIA
ncbi:MAG: NADH-quinone oxidoreductase subunit L [bacterium]